MNIRKQIIEKKQMNSFQKVEYVFVKWLSRHSTWGNLQKDCGENMTFSSFPCYLGLISEVLENLQVVFCKSTFFWSLCMWNVGLCVEIAKFLLTCSMWLGYVAQRISDFNRWSSQRPQRFQRSSTQNYATRLLMRCNWSHFHTETEHLTCLKNLFRPCQFWRLNVSRERPALYRVCFRNTKRWSLHLVFFWNLQLFNHWNSKHLIFWVQNSNVEVKGVLCSGRRRCTDVPHLGCWIRGAEPAQQSLGSRKARRIAASGTSRTRPVF